MTQKVQGEYKTKKKELILKFMIENSQRHVCAEDVLDYLSEKCAHVGKSTVYRCLDRLVEQGVVRRYFLEEGMRACYQYAKDDENCKEHFHLKCICCGKLIHVECDYLSDLGAHVLQHHGFAIDQTKTVLYGLCANCAANGGKS